MSLVSQFVPLPVCDHSQGTYFPPNRIVFRFYSNKQTQQREEGGNRGGSGTVAVLSCGSCEHAKRLPSNADTTIWQVCLKCTLTFVSSCTRSQKTHFSSIHMVTTTVFILFWLCSSCPGRHRTGSKNGSKCARMVWRIALRIFKALHVRVIHDKI